MNYHCRHYACMMLSDHEYDRLLFTHATQFIAINCATLMLNQPV